MEKNLTKLGKDPHSLDEIDIGILALLQENCKLPLARIGRKVGLSAPSVIDRIKRMEEEGLIQGYHARLDARKLGKDVTGFVGVSIAHPRQIDPFVTAVRSMREILECHHVTGGYTLLLKVKLENTTALEDLIRRIRSQAGVERTETMIALSTPTERVQIDLGSASENGHNGGKRRRKP
ncbi:MAG: Lrp/AsnC family transcriptional regulator [Nitrospirae bacterium]|nr:Lrp/AsnC family transcriptional regulator [Nitrospirota bacterium]